MTLENPMIAAQERHDAEVDAYCAQITYSVERDTGEIYVRDIKQDGLADEEDAIKAAKELCQEHPDDMFYVVQEHPDDAPEYLHTFVWCDALSKAVDESEWVEEVAA